MLEFAINTVNSDTKKLKLLGAELKSYNFFQSNYAKSFEEYDENRSSDESFKSIGRDHKVYFDSQSQENKISRIIDNYGKYYFIQLESLEDLMTLLSKIPFNCEISHDSVYNNLPLITIIDDYR